jgi:hypothetical protein
MDFNAIAAGHGLDGVGGRPAGLGPRLAGAPDTHGRRHIPGIPPGVPVPLSTSMEEERLAEAEVCLYRAKLEAILGRRYDSEEYDRVLERYRAAKRHADAARLAARQAHAGQAALSSKRGGVPLGLAPLALGLQLPHAA